MSAKHHKLILATLVVSLTVVLGLKWNYRQRGLEDGLHELGQALTRGGTAEHFHIYVRDKPLAEQAKAKLLVYLRQTYITDPIEKVEIVTLKDGSLPFLHIQTKAKHGTPGYLIITAMRADQGAATSLRGLLETFWGYEEIGKEGRAARHAGEPSAAYAKLCLRDGPALESLGLFTVAEAFGLKAGGWKHLSDDYLQLAELGTPQKP